MDALSSNYTSKIIRIGIVVLVLLLVFGSAFVQVGPGQRGVLLTWGAVNPGVLDPGLHFKLPIAQDVIKVNVQVQKSEAQEAAASLDLQDVQSTVATNWHILPADAEWVYQNVGNEDSLIQKIINPAISNAVKAVSAQSNAEDLIVHRDVVRSKIEDAITLELKKYRIVVDSVNIVDFHFGHEFAQAIEQKQVSQQHAQQAEYELQRAKVLAQQKIVEAQAQSESQKLLQATITPDIIRQQAVAKWNGVLPQVIGGSGVMPMIGNLSSSKPDQQ
jgi:regulator of protease activity HflC (stomatin/prohibitin superfamily)